MENFNLSSNSLPYQGVQSITNAKIAESLNFGAFGTNYNNGCNTTHIMPFILNRSMEYCGSMAGPSATLLLENMSANRSQYATGTRTANVNYIQTHDPWELADGRPTTNWQQNAMTPCAQTAHIVAAGHEINSATVTESSRPWRRNDLPETSGGHYICGQSGESAAEDSVKVPTKREYPSTSTSLTKQSSSTNNQLKSKTVGLHIFTGNVEKILKWHKIVQNLDVECLMEVIARCVNIRAGRKLEKNILLRDQTGPVLVAVFYEIDFLMVQIRVPSTVRIVGKMTGVNKMQAYKVRAVTGVEMTSLPRLAAISQHIITKWEKEKTSAP